MKIEFVKSKKKDSYPSKRSMNLYYKPDRTKIPMTVALYVLFALVILLGLSKFLIYDMMVSASNKEAEYNDTQQQLEQYLVQVQDYDSIELEYNRYAATDDEESQVDRMEILALIDQTIGTVATVDSISISGDQALVQFSGITLQQAASIVNNLEASALVKSTTLNTAYTTEQGDQTIQANLVIDLQAAEGGDDA